MYRIGRYEVVERLGSGGFATVYRVRDPVLDSDVAAKVLAENWSDGGELHQRFIREAQMLRRIDSERVVTVHDIGDLPSGQPYFVMALIDRGTLDERLVRMAPSTEEIQAIAAQLAECMATVHDHGLIHRDIKPSNLLIAGPRAGAESNAPAVLGPRERLILGDFGLAKDIQLQTRVGMTIAAGTGGYAAPEQMTPDGMPDRQTDFYAATGVMYRVLTATTPPEFDLVREMVPFPPADPVMQGPLGQFFRRGMAIRLIDRHTSIEEWLAEFNSAIGAISAASPNSGAETIIGDVSGWAPPAPASVREPTSDRSHRTAPGHSGPTSNPATPPPPGFPPAPSGPVPQQPAAHSGLPAPSYYPPENDQSQDWSFRPEPFAPRSAPNSGPLSQPAQFPQPAQFSQPAPISQPGQHPGARFQSNPAGVADSASYQTPHQPVSYENVQAQKGGLGRWLALAAVVVAAVAGGLFFLLRPQGPEIDGPEQVLAGESVTYEASIDSTDEFRWTDWNGTQRDGPSFTVDGIVPGSLSFSVVGLDEDEETASTDFTVEIVENPNGPRIIGPAQAVVGETTAYTFEAPEGATDPQWLDDNPEEKLGGTYDLTPSKAGTYRVSLIVTQPDGKTKIGTTRTIELVEGP